MPFFFSAINWFFLGFAVSDNTNIFQAQMQALASQENRFFSSFIIMFFLLKERLIRTYIYICIYVYVYVYNIKSKTCFFVFVILAVEVTHPHGAFAGPHGVISSNEHHLRATTQTKPLALVW